MDTHHNSFFGRHLARQMLAGLSMLCLAAPLHAQEDPEDPSVVNTVTESFRGQTLENPTAWEVGCIPYYGTLVPRLTAAGLGDPATDGWLRLTENTGNQSGYIRYKGNPIRSEGLTIYAAFDFIHWDSGGGNENRTKSADGTVFFIYDADAVDRFNIGAYGGSLGYAQRHETTLDGANAAPNSLTARSAGTDEINLFWVDASVVEEGFAVERSPNGNNNWTLLGTVPNNCTSYTDSGLTANTTYYYRVRAIDSTGHVPATNSNVADARTDASYDDGSGGSEAVITLTLQVNSYSDRSNRRNTLLLYINGSNVQTWTLELGANTLTYTSSAPISLNQIRVGFTPYSNPPGSGTPTYYGALDYIEIEGDRYQAEACSSNTSYQAGSPPNYTYIIGGDRSDGQYTDKLLLSGSTRYINFGTWNSSQQSNPPSHTGPYTPVVPGVPTAVSVVNGGIAGNVTVSWTAPSGPRTGFQVEYAPETEDLQWTTQTTSGTSIDLTNLVAGMRYLFRVRTLNGATYSASTTPLGHTLDRFDGTLFLVRALGYNSSGGENIRLLVNNGAGYQEYGNWTLRPTFNTYPCYVPGDVPASAVRIAYRSGGTHALVDWLRRNGTTTYQTELCSTNTAASRPSGIGAQTGGYSEWLWNANSSLNNYVDFASYKAIAPINVLGGLTGGYIGIGIDDWGNYSNPNEGRIGGPGFIANAVSARGDEASGYRYLMGTGDANVRDLPYEMDFPAAQTRPSFSFDRRRIALIITPDNQLTVFLQYGSGDMDALFTADLSSQRRPENILFGFVSATGGTYAYHEIRDVVVTTFEALPWDNESGNSSWNQDVNWLYDKTPAHSNREDVMFENTIRRQNGGNDPGTGRDLLEDGQEDVNLGGSAVGIRTITFSTPATVSGDPSFTYRLYNGSLVLTSETSGRGLSINSTYGTHIVDVPVRATEDFNLNATAGNRLNMNGSIDNGGNLLRLTGLGRVDCNGLISGTGGLRIEDDGSFYLQGNQSNTFEGVVSIEEGDLHLNKRQGLTDEQERQQSYTATGSGPLIIGAVDINNINRRGIVYLDNHNQINDGSDVNLDGGELHLNGKSEY